MELLVRLLETVGALVCTECTSTLANLWWSGLGDCTHGTASNHLQAVHRNDHLEVRAAWSSVAAAQLAAADHVGDAVRELEEAHQQRVG